MSNYIHILLATDFSPESALAAERAAHIARDEGSALSVLHVVEYVPPGYVAVQLPAEYGSPERLIAAARAHLSNWVREQGLEVANEWVEAGSSKSEIVRVARANQVDLIVLATHGEGLLRTLLGSTATAVLHDAPCDVLVVHARDAR